MKNRFSAGVQRCEKHSQNLLSLCFDGDGVNMVWEDRNASHRVQN